MIDQSFVGINKADILEAEVNSKGIASITVRFVSQLITATRDNKGTVIDGDETRIKDVTDIWTFSRDISSEGCPAQPELEAGRHAGAQLVDAPYTYWPADPCRLEPAHLRWQDRTLPSRRCHSRLFTGWNADDHLAAFRAFLRSDECDLAFEYIER